MNIISSSPYINMPSTLQRVGSWSSSIIGRTRIMMEGLTVCSELLAEKYEFFAVFGGHGGYKVLNACQDRFHHIVREELERCNRGDYIDWKETMEVCYSKMDDEVELNFDNYESEENIDIEDEEVGSTALVVVIDEEELVIANCGDSRAVFCRGGVTIPLSFDHKPTRIDEKERVEAAGGRILNWNGARVQGIVPVTRAIGDHFLRPFVISIPEVTVTKRTDGDEFLIVATKSLWEVISSEMATHIVSSYFNHGERDPEITSPASILTSYAIAKGIEDNISVIVIDLHKSRNATGSGS